MDERELERTVKDTAQDLRCAEANVNVLMALVEALAIKCGLPPWEDESETYEAWARRVVAQVQSGDTVSPPR